MEFKRCCRCGDFFVSSDSDVCNNCMVKDKNDIAKLNYIISSSNIDSAYELSNYSGVKLDNINRYIDNNSITLL